MSGFHNCRACWTEVSCREHGRCLEASSALPPSEPQGSSERSRLATCCMAIGCEQRAVWVVTARSLHVDPIKIVTRWCDYHAQEIRRNNSAGEWKPYNTQTDAPTGRVE